MIPILPLLLFLQSVYSLSKLLYIFLSIAFSLLLLVIALHRPNPILTIIIDIGTCKYLNLSSFHAKFQVHCAHGLFV